MVYQKDLYVKVQIVLIGCIVLFSCYKTIDITEDKVLRGGYKNGMILLLKEDVLITHNGMLWDHKPDINIVKEGGQPNEYKGILKSGAKIKIERIELYSHIEDGDYIYPIGKVVSGDWKGEEVNLYFASKPSGRLANESCHIETLVPDPDLFEIVKNRGGENNVQ